MSLYWVAILLMVLIGLTFFRFEHGARKLKIFVIVAIAALIYLSIVNVLSSREIDATSPKSVMGAVYYYFGWVGDTLSNLWEIGSNTVSTVGNAVKLGNSTKN